MGKFKQGDRVKLADCGNVQAEHGLKVGSVGTVNENNSTCPYVVYDDVGGLVATNEERLELLTVASITGTDESQSTVLTIEAGKYYRTRDGRKVGPMYRETLNDQYLDQSESITTYGWHTNGTYIHGVTGALDLIAEWVDEPTAGVKDTNNTTPPVAKQEDNQKLTSADGRTIMDVTNGVLTLEAATFDIQQKPTLVCTKRGYGFEIARHGDYVWVDTGLNAPIAFKAANVKAA